MHISSYSSIFAIGHKAISELTLGPVNVEEKIDGSQGTINVRYDEDGQLTLNARSKGADLHVDAPEKMFAKLVETLRELAPLMKPGLNYRGEFLGKPKHNTLAYDRVPAKNFIIFDIDDNLGTFLSYEEKAAEAARLGLEVVPLLFSGTLAGAEGLRALLDRTSILGGQKIEGVVVKPAAYNLFGPDKKVLMGKFVSEAFKEVHQGEWKKNNPSRGDVVQSLIIQYQTPARWAKAVQHLKEAGKLEGSPRDIGNLIKEVKADVLKEEKEEIKEKLFKYAWEHIERGIVAGLPQWYKESVLLPAQFETGNQAKKVID